VAHHLGTLGAVSVYFRQDMGELFKTGIGLLKVRLRLAGQNHTVFQFNFSHIARYRVWIYFRSTLGLFFFGSASGTLDWLGQYFICFYMQLTIVAENGSCSVRYPPGELFSALEWPRLFLFSGVSRSGICITAGLVAAHKRRVLLS